LAASAMRLGSAAQDDEGTFVDGVTEGFFETL
jgi:hypothetical protein